MDDRTQEQFEERLSVDNESATTLDNLRDWWYALSEGDQIPHTHTHITHSLSLSLRYALSEGDQIKLFNQDRIVRRTEEVIEANSSFHTHTHTCTLTHTLTHTHR
jgi:hypothetical protein